jgi:plasmid maintenance system killer protein
VQGRIQFIGHQGKQVLLEDFAKGGSWFMLYALRNAYFYGIRINDQWRICFEWREGAPGPANLEIVDYH